jgi:hypothetical protein
MSYFPEKTFIPSYTKPVSIMPNWVYQTLVKNKINVMDFKNYGKIRSVLSLNDLKDWALAVRSLDTLKANYRLPYIFKGIWESNFIFNFEKLTTEQEQELHYSVLPLVGTEENINYIKNRLSCVPDEEMVLVDQERISYKFVQDIDTLYIIVDTGFIDTLQSKEGAFRFSRDCVRQFYLSMPLYSLSELGIYTIYLKEIQASSLT